MSKIAPVAKISLPKIMVAPNGARRSKDDHPNLPITIEETISATLACKEAGADGLHMHIRDANGQHTLDAGIYREALAEAQNALPDFYVQITTEAVGQYSPQEQRDVVKSVMPDAVSISIKEMLSDEDIANARTFYSWCDEAGISVQHIIYDLDDLMWLERIHLLDDQNPVQLLFVLGRYTKGQQSRPSDLDPFYNWLEQHQPNADWAVCAFGQGETDCLISAYQKGGKIRVGFENSLWNKDGSLAENNAERVAEVARHIQQLK